MLSPKRMPSGAEEAVTVLLQRVRNGDAEAANRLIAIVFKELHGLARLYMRCENPRHTLQPTALVNEAYLRLVADQARDWQNRSHFIGVAASVMRRVLIDHARARKADKRQQPHAEAALFAMSAEEAEELLLLNVALDRLERLDARQARVVELRYFGGLSVEEAAEAMNVSTMTIKRDWTLARAWLKHQVRPFGGRPSDEP